MRWRTGRWCRGRGLAAWRRCEGVTYVSGRSRGSGYLQARSKPNLKANHQSHPINAHHPRPARSCVAVVRSCPRWFNFCSCIIAASSATIPDMRSASRTFPHVVAPLMQDSVVMSRRWCVGQRRGALLRRSIISAARERSEPAASEVHADGRSASFDRRGRRPKQLPECQAQPVVCHLRITQIQIDRRACS